MYCKYCGEQIPEGEVCFCEDAVSERLKQQRQGQSGGKPSGMKAVLKKIREGNLCADVSVRQGFYFAGIEWLIFILTLIRLVGMYLKTAEAGQTTILFWVALAGTYLFVKTFLLTMAVPVVGKLFGSRRKIKTIFISVVCSKLLPSGIFLLAVAASYWSVGSCLALLLAGAATSVITYYVLIKKCTGDRDSLVTVLLSVIGFALTAALVWGSLAKSLYTLCSGYISILFPCGF